MIKVSFEPVAKTAETDPYRPIVISNHGEIRTLRCFFREFLSDQRGVEESMYTPGVSKPDISFTIHQLCHLKRVAPCDDGLAFREDVSPPHGASDQLCRRDWKCLRFCP